MANTYKAQVLLPKEAMDKVKALAKADRRSVSEYLRLLIEKELENR